jgi:hypothetical protein
MTSNMKTKEKKASSFIDLRARSKAYPMNVSGFWSYPALVKGEQDTLCRLILILGATYLQKEKKTMLFRPKSLLITNQSGSQIMQFQDFRIGKDPFKEFSWEKPVGAFPHKGLAKEMSYSEYRDSEERLLSLYPEAERMFVSDSNLPVEFRKAFLDLLHPCFLPFLNRVAPHFVKALDLSESLSLLRK